MASIPTIPTYFLAPNCDFPPDGLIALGSIIVDPKSPHKTLNHRNNQRVAVPAGELQESFKDNWEDVVKSTKSFRIGLWASFLQMLLGAGADINAGRKNGREDVYQFHRLETKYFVPDMEYIQESLRSESVAAYISATRRKKPIYMVTGVKIARGALVTSKTIREYDGMLKVGLDTTVVTGVPISAGPQLEKRSSSEREAKFGGGSDYVFAYRLVKIQLDRDGYMKNQTDFVKGALFTDDDDEKQIPEKCCVEVVATTREELQSNQKVSRVYEDGEEVAIFV